MEEEEMICHNICVQLMFVIPVICLIDCSITIKILSCTLCYSTVVSGGVSPLSEHPDHPRRHQTRPERRQRNSREAERQETVTDHVPTGAGHGQRNRCRQIPRMLGAHSKGTEKRIWWGHSSRTLSETKAQEKEEMCNPVDLVGCNHVFVFLH